MADVKGRILIVDPDPATALVLTELLESLGNQVVAARTGDEGLLRFWEFLPDLAFVDILRLGDSGERMCRELKRTDYGVITPIVVLSDRHPAQTRVDVMRNYGAVDYVVKPFQESKVRALIDWVLATKDDSRQPIAHEALERFTLSSDSEGVVSLESGSLPYLLGRAEEEKLSGLLLMIAGNHKNVLVLEQGLIVGASSNAPAEQVERVLLSMRKLTPAQLADAKTKAPNAPDLFPLLSFLGILRGEERKEVLRYQALTIGVSMFRVMSGLLQFRRGESLDCPRLDSGIRPTTLALIGLRKNAALLRTATERFVRDPVVFLPPSATARLASRTLPLTKFERTVLSSVDGERSVKELRELGRLAQIDLDEPLAVLVGSGILKPSSAQPASKNTPRAEPAAHAASTLPASGNLERWPFIKLVGLLLSEGATGMLTVEAGANRSFAFLDREIVYARSNKPEDSLGRLLVAGKIISREALDRALALQRQLPDRRLGSLLVEMHELTPDALYGSLRAQIIRILEDTFAWPFGKFSFVASVRPPEWTVRLDTEPVALLRNGTAKMSHKQLKARWSGAEAYLVANNPIGDTAVLTGLERELLTEAGKERGIDLSTGDIGVLRRANLLVVAGFAHVVGEEDRVEPQEPATDAATATGDPATAPSAALARTAPPAASGPALGDGRAAELRLEFIAPADPVAHYPAPSDPTRAILDFLRDEVVADKRSLEARLGRAEAELRQTMEELGRLRERTRHLESENHTLRQVALPSGAADTVERSTPAVAAVTVPAPAPEAPDTSALLPTLAEVAAPGEAEAAPAAVTSEISAPVATGSGSSPEPPLKPATRATRKKSAAASKGKTRSASRRSRPTWPDIDPGPEPTHGGLESTAIAIPATGASTAVTTSAPEDETADDRARALRGSSLG